MSSNTSRDVEEKHLFECFCDIIQFLCAMAQVDTVLITASRIRAEVEYQTYDAHLNFLSMAAQRLSSFTRVRRPMHRNHNHIHHLKAWYDTSNAQR